MCFCNNKKNMVKKIMTVSIILLFMCTSFASGMNVIKDNNMFDEYKRTKQIYEELNENQIENTDIEIENSHDITLKFYFTKPEIIKKDMDDQIYHSIQMSGLSNFRVPGKPVLPMKTVKILIPYGKEIDDILVYPGEEMCLSGSYMIEPGQDLYQIDEYDVDEEIRFTPPDDESYISSVPYPDVLYENKGIQICKGYHILFLDLYPVQYIPKTKEIYYYNDMTVLVSTKHARSQMKTYRGLYKDKDYVSDLVDNCDEISSYLLFDNPHEIHKKCEYIIITTDEYKDAFMNLTNWKETRGKYTPFRNLTTKIMLLDDIVSNSDYWYGGKWSDDAEPSMYNDFNDTQCIIRNFIKMAYMYWGADYVILGGDADEDEPVIPCRKLYGGLVSDPDDLLYSILFPCDMYYGCLDGCWDNDADGVFGEGDPYDYGGEDEESDLFAEVVIGRAPVDSVGEVDNFVRKTIGYENATSNNDDYLQNALMIGNRLFEYSEGANVKDSVTTIIPQYTTSKAYVRDGTYDTNYIIDQMERGTHIINYAGHGSVGGFSGITVSNVPNLQNDKYFFFYNLGCHTASFDHDESLGEIFVTSSSGAFAYIGNSRSSVDVSGIWDNDFFRTLMNRSSRGLSTSIGTVLQVSREHISPRRSCYVLNLLGDPETQIKTTLIQPTAQFKPILSSDFLSPYTYSGIVDISGIAMRGNAPGTRFSHYTIEYGEGFEPKVWLSEEINLTDNGFSETTAYATMATWNTSKLNNGVYTLRLTVFDGNGNVGRDWRIVRVANAMSVHNIVSNKNYSSIQSAMDDADNGDTIYVDSRVYYENIQIDKSINLIGADKETTIIDGNAIRCAVDILCDDVYISGFTIKNYRNHYPSLNHGVGIMINSNNNIITENIITDNKVYGILIAGIHSNNNTIYSNTINNSSVGIWIRYRSSGCGSNIINNTIVNNNAGIKLDDTDDAYIMGNTISKNVWGILCINSNNNFIYCNDIINNTISAIKISSCGINTFYYNNFIDNGVHVEGNSIAVQLWYNDYFQHGNYWDNYYGDDLNDDGIGDWPHFVSGEVEDLYPLIDCCYPHVSIISQDSGAVGDSIEFTGMPFGLFPSYTYSWDFGDNTPVVIEHSLSLSSVKTHTYSNAENYTITLTINSCDSVDICTFNISIFQYQTIVYVDDDYSDLTPGWGHTHFDNILDAIYHVADGGCVYVSPGTYYGQININKSINLIGENKNSTFIDGAESSVTITTDYVNISGFTVQNGNIGMVLINAKKCSMFDNNLKNLRCSIYMVLSSNNLVYHNNFINCDSQSCYESINNKWYNEQLEEGNYWSDYTLKYPQATNNGFIWNIPYDIISDDETLQDMYPLVYQY